MTMPDPEAVAAVLADASERLIMPKYGKLAEDEVSTKSAPGDLVTAVDIAVEAFLERALGELAPYAGFLGEEKASGEPAIMEKLEGKGAYWVADPLDGTRNFVRGLPEFGTILALVVDGVTEQGYIYASPERACAFAVRGKGVFWRGEKLAPKRGEANAPPNGYRSTGWLSPADKEIYVEALRTRVASSPSHCSAYTYLHLIEGEIDFAFHSRIHAWDHLAGALMLEELGGAAAFLDDDEPLKPIRSCDRPMLCAAPARSWEAIAARLRTGA